MTIATALALVPASASGAGPNFPAEPNDPYFDLQWHLQTIQAPEAWAHASGKGALVAIHDRGIDTTHPDLRSQVKRMRDFRPKEERSNFQSSHGMHVAGIVAAAGNNGMGVVGVAPEARLLDIRRNYSDDVDGLIKEIRTSIRLGADVLNFSFGDALPLLSATSDEDKERLNKVFAEVWDSGAMIVASADNLSLPFCNWPSSGYKVLCVGATNRYDLKTPYSNFDAQRQATYVTAPGGGGYYTHGVSDVSCGEQILSTVLFEGKSSVPLLFPYPSECSPETGYDEMAGTSMAAPVVSGVAALLISQGLTNEQVVDRIIATADDLGVPGWDPVFGYGRVNAYRAVTNSTISR